MYCIANPCKVYGFANLLHLTELDCCNSLSLVNIQPDSLSLVHIQLGSMCTHLRGCSGRIACCGVIRLVNSPYPNCKCALK